MTGSRWPRTSRTFPRSVGSLQDIFEFIEGYLDDASVPRTTLLDVQFVVEELFTNQVKYAMGGRDPIAVELHREGDTLRVSLTDFDVEPFDVRQAPEAAVDAPIEERRPGGLGIHLVKKMVDEISYEYEDRRSTTTFTKSLR